jgi:opacity protein-like surface antigen
MKKLLLVAALSAPLLSGCIVAVSDGEVEHGWASEYNGNSWQSKHQENRKKIASLELGDDYNQVLGQFSTPDFTELVKKDNAVYKVIYIATNSKHSDGKVTKDECTPLVFKDGQLIGFGQSALSQIL